jgi:hypothetical protein
MKRLFASSAVPNAASGDDWRIEQTLKSFAKTYSLNRSLRQAAIRPLGQDSNRSTADSWRHALVSADRWVVDASNRIGAAR